MGVSPFCTCISAVRLRPPQPPLILSEYNSPPNNSFKPSFGLLLNRSYCIFVYVNKVELFQRRSESFALRKEIFSIFLLFI